MKKFKIYEVKSSASKNFKELMSKDEKYFYWNDKRIPNDEVGDYVFIIDRNNKTALYTTIELKDILPEDDSDSEMTIISDLGEQYIVEGGWGNFLRFKIISKVEISPEWKWTRYLGAAETFNLFTEEPDEIERKIEKINDLKEIFTEGEAYQELLKLENNLSAKTTIHTTKSDKLVPSILKILESYPDATQTKPKAIADIIQNEIPLTLNELLKNNSTIQNWLAKNKKSIQGSVGKGAWSVVPWVAILNPTITKSVSEKVYIVFLFCADGSGVYLSIGQGTGGIDAAKPGEELIKMRDLILNGVDSDYFQKGPLSPGSLKGGPTPRPKAYEKSCILSKYYGATDLVNLKDHELIIDLEKILRIYTNLESTILNQLSGNRDDDQNDQNILNYDYYTNEDALKDLFISEDIFDSILNRLQIKKNIVIQGPPGVGKTFLAKRVAYCLNGAKDTEKTSMVQFHQSYSYEDFIQGFRPNREGKFDLRNGVFFDFCKLAQDDPYNSYTFIIDEINRGNLGKIFGELFMLIEADKRNSEYAVPLTYSKNSNDKFHIPPNLYLIGTMNTADRSLAMVDYALRRRFSFVYLKPQFESPKFKDYLLSKGVSQELANKIIPKVKELNNIISEDTKNLGKGYCVGHSYFCPIENGNNDQAWYSSIIESEIRPLLEEYWFDDEQKVESLVNNLLA